MFLVKETIGEQDTIEFLKKRLVAKRQGVSGNETAVFTQLVIPAKFLRWTALIG